MRKPINIKRKLDQTFSKFIRARDTNDGYGKCVTCGAIKPYEDLDCGHYISRQHLATRWSEKNCAVQCIACNRFKGGMQDEFALYLIKKHGQGILEELSRQKWTPVKITELEMIGMEIDLKERT